MRINLQKPIEQFVLVDTKSKEFYCGKGYTTSNILLASNWMFRSTAKGVKTKYENDFKNNYFFPRSNSIINFEVKKIIIDNYCLI